VEDVIKPVVIKFISGTNSRIDVRWHELRIAFLWQMYDKNDTSNNWRSWYCLYIQA